MVLRGLLPVLALMVCPDCKPETSSAPPPPPAPEVPRLAVLVVIDQLRGDELWEHRALFRYGLRRLLDEGRWYTQAYHGHGRTNTAPGHATISTGVYPRDHGVVDNTMHVEESGKVLSACEFGAGPCDPDILWVATLGDRLKAQSPTSQVVAIAQKARSAMLLGGKRADMVAWTQPWSRGISGVTGRTLGKPGVPRWLSDYYSQVAGPDRIARIWELPRLPQTYATLVDAGTGEANCGHGTTFPHVLPQTKDLRLLYEAWMATPDSDRALVEVVLESVRKLGLGNDAVPDLLAVSFGAFDYIGHHFGPDSLERVAALTQLDRQLGDLLDGVTDAVNGPVVLGLTSDHGIAPVVDVACGRGHDSSRPKEEQVLQPLASALQQAFGRGDLIASLQMPFITLRKDLPAPRAEVVQQLLDVLRGMPDIEAAFAVDSLSPDAGELQRLLYRSAARGRSGDVAIVLKPYKALWPKDRGALGAEHGSPWKYDRHVPVIMWGDRVPASKVEQEVEVIDLTRTLADRLRLTPLPNGGRPLP